MVWVRVAWSLVFCVVFCRLLFVLFLLAIVLSVILRFINSDYPFGIFKLFFGQIVTIIVLFDIERSMDFSSYALW
jgi:hypothetical protein